MAQQPVPQHGDLPLPDYDHLPQGSVQSRIRTLDAQGVDQVLAYERRHASRPLIVELLQRRAEELASGVEPSPGSPADTTPELAGSPCRRFSRLAGHAGSAGQPAIPRCADEPGPAALTSPQRVTVNVGWRATR
jgi:hypothetical protein